MFAAGSILVSNLSTIGAEVYLWSQYIIRPFPGDLLSAILYVLKISASSFNIETLMHIISICSLLIATIAQVGH